MQGEYGTAMFHIIHLEVLLLSLMCDLEMRIGFLIFIVGAWKNSHGVILELMWYEQMICHIYS